MIVPMKKVSLMILGSKKKEALKTLRKLGLLQIEITEGSGQRLIALKEQIALLENAVFTVGKAKVTTAQTATTDEALAIAREIAQLAETQKNYQAQKLNFQAELERLNTRQTGQEKTHADQQAEIARLNGEITALRETVAVRRKLVTDERIVQAARERGLTALSADLNRMTGEHTDLTKERDDSRRALSEVEAALAAVLRATLRLHEKRTQRPRRCCRLPDDDR